MILRLRKRLADAPQIVIVLLSSIAAFSIYVCTYGFRKGFAANTYDRQSFWGIDYKILLVIAQIIGYAFSKFLGIRFIAEIKPHQRLISLLVLTLVAWLSLLVFALAPTPWGILCLLVNGIPLGLIWGLIYSYLEGRKQTELMGAILCTSFIFSSGFVKTIGQTMLHSFGVAGNWMPFIVGAIFVLPLLFFSCLLDLMPPPTAEDKAIRMERMPMYAAERRGFLKRFWPGLLFNILLYISLTAVRDIRDYFEIEIWQAIDPGAPASVYTTIDGPVSLCILVCMSLLICIKNNRTAFQLAHLVIFTGFIMMGTASTLYTIHLVPAYLFMYMTSFGLYLSYVPYSILFFDRLIAVFRIRGNVGFCIYFADSIGYTCSVAITFYKQFGTHHISWGGFFIHALLAVAVVGICCIGLSYRYFMRLLFSDGDRVDATDAQGDATPLFQ